MLLATLFASRIVSQAPAAAPAASSAPLGKAATEALCARFQAAEHWVQKAVILLSFGTYWHPSGSTAVLAALRDSDKRLRAFGVETLLRADSELLPSVASGSLVDELVKQSGDRNAHYRERVLEALKRIAPDAKATDSGGWTRWWRASQATYNAKPWQPRTGGDKQAGGTVAGVADRAFDLYSAGLDLVLCIDSTGSMQPTIDALAAALDQLVDILGGISPKLRLGIVHYKDSGELGKTGAKLIQALARNVKVARDKLLKLRAFGGGDLPEAVAGGLELALSRRLGWNPDANKLVVVIGDAPPHEPDVAKAIDLAKRGFTNPDSVSGSNQPVTGPRRKQRPFLTSAIGVVLDLPPAFRSRPGYGEFTASQKRMQETFAELAKAGGGVYETVRFKVRAGPPSAKERKERKKNKGAVDPAAARATHSIAEHVLVLTFGARFAAEMKALVKIYFDYKNAGLFS